MNYRTIRRVLRRGFYFAMFLLFLQQAASAQLYEGLNWNREGNGFYLTDEGSIVENSLLDGSLTTIVSRKQLTPKGENLPLSVKLFSVSDDDRKVLIYTHAQKVWRYETRGDYWVFDRMDLTLKQLGRTLPPASLMFAKFSPDGTKAAYVSDHNIYVEDMKTNIIKSLTRNGTRKMINGTFDWVYEEELDCRDGFRWSPDSKSIAFWQINDSSTRDYYMLNTTDSVYSRIVPVEYPVTGQKPSPARIGVISIEGGKIQWMNIPTDAQYGSYLPRMAWAADGREVIVQRLNRNQNETDILLCNVANGSSRVIYSETDTAWIDVITRYDISYQMGGWDWLQNGAAFVWVSEKDGWRHLYSIGRDGKHQTLITGGMYDVIRIIRIDEKNNRIFFLASPDNATQAYLYTCPLDGTGIAVRLTPYDEPGTHNYEVSPNGRFARHNYSNYYTPPDGEWITLPNHLPISGSRPVPKASAADSAVSNISFFSLLTADGVSMDGWMQKPVHFDPAKKYPVLFFVYTEPGQATVVDEYGITSPLLQTDWLAKEGYIYISIDNRGTPAPKGSAWRKSIYRKIGQLNIQDQAHAAAEICKWPFVDSSRIAVWGWSSGGSATLNLLFQYPEIYKTGISVAALTDMEAYDNIYEERYMGNPLITKMDYMRGSPLTYAQGLRGNLLFIHGSGDDNVHYNNAEKLLNVLIGAGKNFQFMEYPNRTHDMDEGAGTTEHLTRLFKTFLNANCPGGGK